MAWRLDRNIVYGEVDNRVPGIVTGFIWIAGHATPINLNLKGNALRDVAGCLLTFVNPSPEDDDRLSQLDANQTGLVGDITASLKVLMPDVSMDEVVAMNKRGENVPEHLANAVYIEWFSDSDGRVVIESSEFVTSISINTWQMTESGEQEQITANKQAVNDFLDTVASEEDEEDLEPAAFTDDPMDEFQWEKFMKESDDRTDVYMKLLDKYEGYPDQEKRVAHEMGWTWLEEALDAHEHGRLIDDAEDNCEEDEDDITDDEDMEPNPLTEGVDWVRDEDGHPQHPLVLKTMDVSLEMWTICHERGLLKDDSDEDLREMIMHIQMAGAKLAGGLDSLAYDSDIEGGFVVACLKRALACQHQAIAALDRVAYKNLLQRRETDTLKANLFAIREETLKLMNRFRHQT